MEQGVNSVFEDTKYPAGYSDGMFNTPRFYGSLIRAASAWRKGNDL